MMLSDGGVQPFFKIERDADCATVWVVFSPVNVPPGKFGQSRVFEEVPGTKIFLNGPRNGWYQGGVPGTGSTLDESLDWLAGEIGRFPCDDLRIVGHSMGAYAALVAAVRFPQSRFLVTSPELALHVPASRSALNKVPRRGDWQDLYAHAAFQSDLSDRGVIIFGACDPVDAYFLAQEETDSGRFGRTFGAPYLHGVTEYLNGLKRYRPALIGLPDSWRALLADGIVDLPQALGTREQYRHFYDAWVLYGREDERQLAAAIDRHTDWANAGWQDLRSRAWRRQGELHKAFEAAETAFLEQPAIPEIAANYGTLAVELKDYVRVGQFLDLLRGKPNRHVLMQRVVDRIERKAGLDVRRQWLLGQHDLPVFRIGRHAGIGPGGIGADADATWSGQIAVLAARGLVGRAIRTTLQALAAAPDDPAVVRSAFELAVRYRRTDLAHHAVSSLTPHQARGEGVADAMRLSLRTATEPTYLLAAIDAAARCRILRPADIALVRRRLGATDQVAVLARKLIELVPLLMRSRRLFGIARDVVGEAGLLGALRQGLEKLPPSPAQAAALLQVDEAAIPAETP